MSNPKDNSLNIGEGYINQDFNHELRELLQRTSSGGFSDGPYYNMRGDRLPDGSAHRSLTAIVERIEELVERYYGKDSKSREERLVREARKEPIQQCINVINGLLGYEELVWVKRGKLQSHENVVNANILRNQIAALKEGE